MSYKGSRALLPSCSNSDIGDIIQMIGLLFQLHQIIAIIFHYITDQNEVRNDDFFCYYFHCFSNDTIICTIAIISIDMLTSPTENSEHSALIAITEITVIFVS